MVNEERPGGGVVCSGRLAEMSAALWIFVSVWASKKVAGPLIRWTQVPTSSLHQQLSLLPQEPPISLFCYKRGICMSAHLHSLVPNKTILMCLEGLANWEDRLPWRKKVLTLKRNQCIVVSYFRANYNACNKGKKFPIHSDQQAWMWWLEK